MFPLRKLMELPPKTRLRKIALILRSMEMPLAGGRAPDRAYLKGLCDLCRGDLAGLTCRTDLAALPGTDPGMLTDEELPRFLNNLRHEILACLGAEAAEWDFIDHEKGTLDPASRLVLPIKVYLEDIRSPYNVGSMFRTAEAFGAEHIYLSPHTPPPTHPRAARTARGCEKVVGWSTAHLHELEQTEGVFALELGGAPLDEFEFPKRGTVLVGSEELGLSPEALELARSGAGRVSISMAGAKRSLNVAAAFAILMQKWYAVLAGKS